MSRMIIGHHAAQYPWAQVRLRLLAPYRLRLTALSRTELAHATCADIRLKLFKIGAVVIRNTRRIRLLLSSHYPYQSLFQLICQRLCPY